MLYFAKVQKRTIFLGFSKTLLKLLAYQPKPNHWQPVSGEEVILVIAPNNFKDGSLVFAELNADKQLQWIQEAAEDIIRILINFYRLHTKYTVQKEEVEQWQESVKFQELQLQHQKEEVKEALKRLEKQQQEIEIERQELARLRRELETQPKPYDAGLSSPQNSVECLTPRLSAE